VSISPLSSDAISAWGIGSLAVIVAIAWVITWSAGRAHVRWRAGIAPVLPLRVAAGHPRHHRCRGHVVVTRRLLNAKGPDR